MNKEEKQMAALKAAAEKMMENGALMRRSLLGALQKAGQEAGGKTSPEAEHPMSDRMRELFGPMRIPISISFDMGEETLGKPKHSPIKICCGRMRSEWEDPDSMMKVRLDAFDFKVAGHCGCDVLSDCLYCPWCGTRLEPAGFVKG